MNEDKENILAAGTLDDFRLIFVPLKDPDTNLICC